MITESTRLPISSQQASSSTPYRVFDGDAAHAAFEGLAQACRRMSSNRLRIQPAYSVKTNPRPEMLRAAYEAGFLAECISSGEVSAARSAGFNYESVVYNGPLPLHRAGLDGAVGIAFADSVESLKGNIAARSARIQGMRLRPNWYESRFGISAEQTIEAVAALASLPAEQPIGVSFHVRPQDRGARSWLEVARTFLQRAAGIERASGRAVVVFDVGGGWTPNELASVVRSELRMFVEEAPSALPNLATILLEPGQSLATPTQFMISSVVEVRRHPHHTEIVIDAGYPNLPLQGTYVHRIYVEDGGGWLLLDEGNDRILGPTCLEYDVVASNVSIPQAVRPSTKIRIADCGSYDASMAFHFARGEEESGVPCRNGRHDQGPKESQS